MTPADLNLQTKFKKARINRAQQPKHFVQLPNYTGNLQQIESRKNIAQTKLSYSECERFCFARQSHLPGTIAEIKSLEISKTNDEHFWMNTKVIQFDPLQMTLADETFRIQPSERVANNCLTKCYHMKNHNYQKVDKIDNSYFWYDTTFQTYHVERK